MILNYERCELYKCFLYRYTIYVTSIPTLWFTANVQHIIYSYVDVTQRLIRITSHIVVIVDDKTRHVHPIS